jgi:hypothetical protein
MNERIRKLALETDVWCDQNWAGHEFYNIRWEEKFAEMLIQECLSILKESQEHYANPIKCEPAEDYVEYYIAMSAKEYAIADAISDIKYRFEVEE